MGAKKKYTFVLFYSTNNPLSLQTKELIKEVISVHYCRAEFQIEEKEVGQLNNPNKYGVKGSPAILILKDGEPSKRHFGEINRDELEVMLEELC
jgi:hypothetical protein